MGISGFIAAGMLLVTISMGMGKIWKKSKSLEKYRLGISDSYFLKWSRELVGRLPASRRNPAAMTRLMYSACR